MLAGKLVISFTNTILENYISHLAKPKLIVFFHFELLIQQIWKTSAPSSAFDPSGGDTLHKVFLAGEKYNKNWD